MVSTNKISNNVVNLYDSWLTDMIEPQKSDFFSFSLYNTFYAEYNPEANNPLANIYILLDETSTIYERRVQTFSYAFSMTGGLLSFVSAILNFVLGSLERHLFLLKKMFFKRDRAKGKQMQTVGEYFQSFRLFQLSSTQAALLYFRSFVPCRKTQVQRLHEKGLREIEGQLDVVKLIRTMRKVNVLARIVLS
jgi:hypothetical protein